MNIADYCELLAQRVRQARLGKTITQADMAARALLSLPACQRFERTGRTSLTSLVRILFVLDGQNDFLSILAPRSEISSLAEFERLHRPARQRARKGSKT